jgi:hypothetical protein
MVLVTMQPLRNVFHFRKNISLRLRFRFRFRFLSSLPRQRFKMNERPLKKARRCATSSEEEDDTSPSPPGGSPWDPLSSLPDVVLAHLLSFFLPPSHGRTPTAPPTTNMVAIIFHYYCYIYILFNFKNKINYFGQGESCRATGGSSSPPPRPSSTTPTTLPPAQRASGTIF